MDKAFLGELFGTMTLILLGDGVVANVLLKNSKGQNSGWIVITTGWAMAVLMGVIVAAAVGSPAHLNPAVTLGLAVLNSDYSQVLPLMGGQFIGAFLGAALVWLTYLPHWGEENDKGAILGIFCTGPAIRNYPANFLTEFIGTFVLLFCVLAIGAKTLGSPGYFSPYIVAMLVWGIGLSLGGPTGYAINPARDLGPRIAHAVLPIAGKGPTDWGYAFVPVIAPVLGGIAGALMARFCGFA